MKPAALREFMAREYPALEVNPLWIHSVFGIKVVELTRSSRGNVTSVRAFGSNAAVDPTIANLRAVIEFGLRAQIRSHQEIVFVLDGIRRQP